MVFSSFTFLIFFLPFTTIIYYLLKQKQRNIFLLVMSLIFYMWGGPQYLLVMVGVIIINYFCGIFIDKFERNCRPIAKKMALTAGIAANLLVLIVFKYTNFAVENINAALPVFGIDPIFMKHILLPVGISFYIFQSISYIVDIYRNEAYVQKKITNLALYISLFPQLVAGPIVRYNTIERQIENRKVTFNAFNTGLKIFILGLGKKVLIANSMAGLADTVFLLDPLNLSHATLWIGAVAYTLQIYFDFSGYSDMAIGLGMMFGFTFPVNFNYPYISTSITEFWRRWHISLSTWFKDYLYIPMGGNRVKMPRIYLNLLIVFTATGIWHGANWTFLIWGLYHGFFIIIDKITGFNNIKRFKALRWFITTIIVIVGWVIFRSDSIPQAITYISIMFAIKSVEAIAVDTSFFMHWQYAVIFAMGIFGATPVLKNLVFKDLFIIEKNPESKQLILVIPKHKIQTSVIGTTGITTFAINTYLLLILFICFLSLANSSYNPFIYFRF